MMEGAMKFKHLFGLLILFIALPISALQNNPDYDEADALADSHAYLNLIYDNSGAANVHLTLPAQPRSWDDITLSLSEMLGCPVGIFRHPQVNPVSLKYFNQLPPRERQKRIEQFEKQYALELNGKCAASLHRTGLIFDGTLDFTRLLTEFKVSGMSSLELQLMLPKLPYRSVTGLPETKLRAPSSLFGGDLNESRFVSIPVSQSGPAPKLHIAVGWSRAAILQTAFRTLIFCLLPIGILLRTRSLSLLRSREDPTGAWFAYMKTLGWCTKGGMLLWYVTNLGGRREIEQMFSVLVSAGPRLLATIDLAVFFIPAAFIYLACISISHRVFVEVKRAQYTWAQFLTEHSLTLAQRILPIALISAAIGLMKDDPRLAGGWIFVAYLLAILLGRSKLKLTKGYPQIVSAGELRDRVFALATKAGVALQQVVILPAQRMQMANAFASAANTVTFTDFLLERMSKREVDAIAGHELTHLKLRHPAKLTLAMLAAVFSPTWMSVFLGGVAGLIYGVLLASGFKLPPTTLATVYRWVGWLTDWGVDGLIAVLLAFAGVYALSRRFERQADAGAVSLTNDPEAMITGLVKLSSLNLMPLTWGNGSGASLTHPSTLKRVQRIAQCAQIPKTRVDELIEQLSVEKLSARQIENVAEQHKEGEHYATEATQGEASHRVLHRMQNVLLILLALLVLPPALIQMLVERLNIFGPARTAIYAFGILFTALACLVMGKLLPLLGLGKQKAARLRELEHQGFDLRQLDAFMVGFGHQSAPRVYLGNYNFDTGLVVLSKERLVYLGGRLKFSISRRQVESIQTGPGAPSWWPQPRIYIRWSDQASGKQGVFNLSSQEPCSLLQLDLRMRELYSKLLSWRVRGHSQQTPPQCEALMPPEITEVTCKSPRESLSLKNQVAIWMLLLGAIWSVSSIMGIHSGYIWLAVLIVRTIEIIPYVRYRDPKQNINPRAFQTKAAAATAGA